jgi:hypothetical protein
MADSRVETCGKQGSGTAVNRIPPPAFQRLLEEFVDVMNPSKKLPATSHALIKSNFPHIEIQNGAVAKSYVYD